MARFFNFIFILNKKSDKVVFFYKSTLIKLRNIIIILYLVDPRFGFIKLLLKRNRKFWYLVKINILSIEINQNFGTEVVCRGIFYNDEIQWFTSKITKFYCILLLHKSGILGVFLACNLERNQQARQTYWMLVHQVHLGCFEGMAPIPLLRQTYWMLVHQVHLGCFEGMAPIPLLRTGPPPKSPKLPCSIRW